jgi:hypothetical protein
MSNNLILEFPEHVTLSELRQILQKIKKTSFTVKGNFPKTKLKYNKEISVKEGWVSDLKYEM